MLRTLMFVPGNQPKRLEKAITVPADGLILDLEDSVPPLEKDSARSIVAGAICRMSAGRQQIFVRVNALSTKYAQADIKAVVTAGIAGICLPKSETADDIRQADALIAEAEKNSGLEPGSVRLLPLIETPKAIVNSYAVVSASPRIIGINFGAEDYALEMGVSRTKEGAEVFYPRIMLPVTCHAANVLAIDCVYTDVKDEEGLIRETREARQLGFQGKMVIHPAQVEPVNSIFTPSSEEVAYAQKVVAAFEAGVAQGLASISLDGKMIDSPVAERARRLLSQYKSIANK